MTSAQEHPMTDAPVSPLRRRMIEDMTIRKFAPRTQEGYIRAVKGFSAFFGASPDKARFEDLRRYQLHLAASGAGTPTINRAALPLPGDAAPAAGRRTTALHPRAAQAAGGAEPGGGGAAARCGAQPQVQGGAERRLWRGLARLRDHLAQDRGHRQYPDGDPGRAGQGPQGPLRDA